MNISENLKAYLDGELTPDETKTVEAALAADPNLRAELEELRSLSTAIQSIARQPQARGYDQAKSRVTTRPASAWPVFVRTLGVVATIAVLASLLFPVFAQSKTAARQMLAGNAEAASVQDSSPASSEFAKESQMNESAAAPADKVKSFDAESASALPPSRERSKSEGAPATVAPSSSPQPSIPAEASARRQTADPRQIIKTAYLTVKVDDVQSLEPQVRNLAKKYGGFIESSSGRHPVQTGSVRTAEFTLRIKVEHFETAFDQLAALGVVLDQSSDGQDVTTEIVDNEARLKTKRAEETQYRELLKTTKKVSEILEVRERLYDVREEIESLDAQTKNL